MKSFPRTLNVWKNCFHVCSACACYNFWKLLKNTKLKCKFWPKIIKILKNRLGTHQIGPKWKFWQKHFLIAHPKKFVPGMLSHRENVRTSKFWQNRRKRIEFFLKIDQRHIYCKVLISSKKNSKLAHAYLMLVRRGSVWCSVAQHGAAWLSYGAAWLSW